MSLRREIAQLNPDGYPIEDAFLAIDRYAAMQNGEPQLIVFGDTLSHYAYVNRSKQGATLPHRKPLFIESYNTVGQMADSLAAQAKTDAKLDPERQYVMRFIEAAFGDRPKELPLTTAQELELEAFELHCLDLNDIREAALQRANGRQDPEDVPVITMVNAATAESRTVTLSATALIANDSLELTRSRHKRQGSNDMTIRTDILLGKFLGGVAAELGLDTENVALLEKKRRKPQLHSAGFMFNDSVRSIFGFGHAVANDFWTEDGKYSLAGEDPPVSSRPPRHSLSEGLNYRRMNSYDAGDFLDAAQDVINTEAERIQEFVGDTIILQPLESFEASLNNLRRSLKESTKFDIYDLGYYAYSGRGGISPFFFRNFVTAFRSDGVLGRNLVLPFEDSPRIALENAARQFERLRTPALVRAGRMAVNKLRG